MTIFALIFVLQILTAACLLAIAGVRSRIPAALGYIAGAVVVFGVGLVIGRVFPNVEDIVCLVGQILSMLILTAGFVGLRKAPVLRS
jgi:hypothetical protein